MRGQPLQAPEPGNLQAEPRLCLHGQGDSGQPGLGLPRRSYCLQECSPACANQEGARKIHHPEGWESATLLHISPPCFLQSPKGTVTVCA